MTKKQYIHLIIMCLLTFAIAYAPAFGDVTRFGMKTLGVFIGVLYGWIAFDLTIPSLFGYFMIAAFGLMDATTAFRTGIGNTNLVTVLAAMVFTVAINTIGVTKVISNFLVTRKIFRKSPWLLVTGFIFTSYVLGMAGVHLAAILLLWAVLMDICKDNNIPKGDKLVTFVILMITVAGFFGVFSVPFRATAMIFESYFISSMNMQFELLPFFTFCLVISAILLSVMIILGKFVFRLDADKFILADYVVEKMKQEKANATQKIGIIFIIAYAVLLIYPSLIPAAPGAALFQRLGVTGISLIGIFLLAIIVIKDKPLINVAKAFTEGCDWQLLLLLSVTFPLAELMQSSDSGIMSTVMSTVAPIVSSMGVTKFIIVSMVTLGIITQVTHNIVLAAMFTPFLCPLCVELGGNPYVMWFFMYLALNASYMTPAASFQSALVFGHEAINKKYTYIYGLLVSVVMWIALAVVGLPLGNMLF